MDSNFNVVAGCKPPSVVQAAAGSARPANKPDAPKEEVVQVAKETVIAAELPFEPAVSDPKALEAARGVAHFESGDAKQLVKGAYNGLVNVLPLLLGPIVGSAAAKLNIPKASIDQRYGGAAIVGEKLAENLALEGAGPAIAAGIPKAAATAVKLELKLEAGALQSRLAFGGLGFWPALKSSVAITRGEVAGELLTVVTHTSPKAYELLESGAVALKPGQLLGPAPQFDSAGKLIYHSEQIGIQFLQFLGATKGGVGTWPLGCRMCIGWIRANARGFSHSNPKP